MKKSNVLLTILLSLSLTVIECRSQDIAHTHGSFYFVNGFQFFNPENFNDQVTSAGYPTLSSNFGSGFGGYGESLRWIYGGEGCYLQRSKTESSKTIQSHGGLGYFFGGLKIVSNTHWKIFPALGIGFGGVTTTLLNEVSSNTSFDDILTTQPNGRVFDNGSVFLHSAMSVEYKFYKYYFAGFKSGYNLSLFGETSWMAPGLDPNRTIKDAFGGYYLNVQAGIYLR